jgi:hypothetical protein
LTSNPESTLRLLCRWLGIAFNPKMLDFHESEEANKTAASGKLWENVKKPVMATNTKKWLTGMTPDQIIDFESVAGRSLMQLGYELEFVGRSQAARTYDAEAKAALDADNRARKATVKEELPPEDAAARKPQEDLLASIRSRLVAV